MTSRWSLSRTFSGMSQARPDKHSEPDVLPPYINDLSDSQLQAFDKFKALVTDKGLYTPEKTDEDGTWKAPSHSTTTLLRFLRARQYNPDAALTQFQETEKWRKEVQLEDSYDTMDVHEFQTAREVYTQWTGRRDKRGVPIFVYQVSKLREKELADYNKPLTTGDGPPMPKLMKLYAVYESLTQFVLPACSRLQANGSVPATSNIVDISNVGLWTFWNLKQHMQEASELATARYPETLDRIFIVGAPSFFSTVWGWIKRWFDPITVSKMFILGPDEVLPTLSRFMDIKDIPKKFGGQLDWEFGDSPNFDDEMREIMGDLGKPDGWLPGSIRYIVGQDHDEIRALGSVDGKRRNELLSTIKHPIGEIPDHMQSVTEVAEGVPAVDPVDAAPAADGKTAEASTEDKAAVASVSDLSTEAFPSTTTVTSLETATDEDVALRNRAASASMVESSPPVPIAAVLESKTTPLDGTLSPREGKTEKLRNLASRFKAHTVEKMHFLDAAKSAPTLVHVEPKTSGPPSIASIKEAEEKKKDEEKEQQKEAQSQPDRPALSHVETNVPAAAFAPSETAKIKEKTVAISDLRLAPENIAPKATEALEHEATATATVA